MTLRTVEHRAATTLASQRRQPDARLGRSTQPEPADTDKNSTSNALMCGQKIIGQAARCTDLAVPGVAHPRTGLSIRVAPRGEGIIGNVTVAARRPG